MTAKFRHIRTSCSSWAKMCSHIYG